MKMFVAALLLFSGGSVVSAPKSLLHIGGREDHQNEFQLQLESVERGRATNGATGTGSACGLTCTLYPSSNGAPGMTVLHPGGHVYPDGATALIVTFFRVHP